MTTYRLQDVFGVRTPAPKQTYVDRAGLDGRMQYLLETGRHLVVYGPSKQGKTELRRRALPDDKCVVVQSRLNSNTTTIYDDVLGKLGIQRTLTDEATRGRDFSITGGGEGGVNIAFLGKAQAKSEGTAATSHESTTTSEPIGNKSSDIAFVAAKIKEAGKRVVIEDFHYMPESAKREFAIDLKALLEEGVPFILIGAWEEQNVLVAYNGDLDGRVDEINLSWTDKELRDVLSKGELALNIRLSDELVQEMVLDASGNVGLLQRIAEKICYEAGCYKTEAGDLLVVSDGKLLQSARTQISSEQAARYSHFGRSISEGFPRSKEKTKSVYMRIIQVCVTATDAELKAGLTENQIVERAVALDPSITRSGIRASLRRIDRLQAEKGIYPVIASYNRVTRTLHLADRELLFYRRHGSPDWPWEDSDE